MRYLWDLYPAYRNEWIGSKWKRALMTPLSNYLRLWDYASSARVDDFIANSDNVRTRIWKTYRRESTVIHPPVAVEQFYWKPSEDYYLMVSELVAYKRVDSAVRVFGRSGRKLRVVGEGPEYNALKRIATNNVEFCGRVTDHELRELYARSRAFLMPGEEDFGIAAIEALASGKPVIALGRGGAVETVPQTAPLGGILYDEATDDALATAIEDWDEMEAAVEPRALQSYAARFSGAEFARKMRSFLAEQAESVSSKAVSHKPTLVPRAKLLR
jgi:glycosyltransferase involved in cell wall biosynthesis